MFSRKTVILDLGSSRTALGAFSRCHGRLRLDTIAVEEFPAPADREADWLEQTRGALSRLRARTGSEGPVVVVTPPHLTLTKQIRTPRVEPAKRRKILRFEAEQNIPYAAHEVVWGTVVAEERELELEVLLVAAKREAMESLCGVVKNAGFEPRVVLPSCLATLAAFRLVQGPPQEPTLVLNLGARSTTLLHATGHRFTVRSLALGTRSILEKSAEGQDQGALEFFVARLAQEITRSVLHLRRQGVAENPSRLCLIGRGARLNGLGEALAAKLRVPVDWLNMAAAIEISNDGAAGAGIGGALTLTDLAGAAATQLRPAQPVLSLLPPSLRRRTKLRRQIRLAGAALCMAAAVWPLLNYLRPVSEPGRLAPIIRVKAAPGPETSASPSVADHPGEPVQPFDLELLAVRAAPFPLQLAGYYGEPGDYGVVFRSIDQPETLLARRGHRFAQMGLTLRSFELRKVAVEHDDAWPVYEVAGFAVLLDEKTGAEVVLDSRRRQADTLQAVLWDAADSQESTRREGELIVQREATYRIERIQADPPEVVMVRQTGGSALPETRVLQPVRPASDAGEQSAGPDTASDPKGF